MPEYLRAGRAFTGGGFQQAGLDLPETGPIQQHKKRLERRQEHQPAEAVQQVQRIQHQVLRQKQRLLRQQHQQQAQRQNPVGGARRQQLGKRQPGRDVYKPLQQQIGGGQQAAVAVRQKKCGRQRAAIRFCGRGRGFPKKGKERKAGKQVKGQKQKEQRFFQRIPVHGAHPPLLRRCRITRASSTPPASAGTAINNTQAASRRAKFMLVKLFCKKCCKL